LDPGVEEQRGGSELAWGKMVNLMTIVTPVIAMTLQSADIDWKDETNLLLARGFFGVGIVACLLSKAYLYIQINKTNDDRRVWIKNKAMFDDPSNKEKREVTVTQHDLEQLNQQMMTITIGIVMAVVLHLRNDWVFPVIMSPIHNLMLAYTNELTQIYILGMSDTGDGNPLKRPWKMAGGISEAWEKAQQFDHKARAAERQDKQDKKKAKKDAKELTRGGNRGK